MKSPEKETCCFVGNDILSTNESLNQVSFSKIKYLDKILSTKEKSFFVEETNIKQLPFVFWTCKESAYKIDLKFGQSYCFIPNEYEVEIKSYTEKKDFFIATGEVYRAERTFFFQSEIFSDYISTIACNRKKGLSKIQNFVVNNENCDPSFELRSLLKNRLAQHFKINENEIEILKSEKGIPYVQSIYGKVLPDISFSHDGSYFSYALLFK